MGKNTKIYTDAGQEIKTIEDWKRQLADPENNWAEGKSACELARSWLYSVGDLPISVLKLLNSSETFRDFIIDKAVAEKKVYFDNLGRPSQADLMIYGQNEKGRIVIAVEGKEKEDFDKDVSRWLKADKEKSNRNARLRGLLRCLNLENLDEKDVGRIKYQLLHRTVSALTEAKKYGARHALMLVHSFSNIDGEDHFEDYLYFCNQMGIERPSIDRDRIIGPVMIDIIAVYFGWLRDKKYNSKNT